MIKKNPYNPNYPVSPKYFANQFELLSTFSLNIQSVTGSQGVTTPTNLAITGRWGMGKTSTLRKFEDIMQYDFKSTQTLSTIVALKPAHCEDSDTFSACILESLFKAYTATTPLPIKVKDFIKDELLVLDAWKLKKLSLTSPEFERNESKVTAINFTDTLLRFWEKLETNGVKMVIIMIDDIHYAMINGKGDIFYNLRTDIQTLGARRAPFMFIICTTDTLYPVIQKFAEPFTRLFDQYDLGPFALEGTKEQIIKPLSVEKIHLVFSQNTIEKIHEITKGHPYFVTLIMRELLMKCPEKTTVIDDFDKYLPDLLDILAKKKFNFDFASVTEAEKGLLFKIAELKKDEFMSNEVKGRTTATLLERLIEKNLIEKTGRGKYRLYTHLFGEYLLREKNRIE